MTKTGRFTTSDGLSLAYEDTGTGTPLLCLPGLTRDARDFDDLRAVQPAGTRLICLTSRGRGASDRDPDFMNYSLPVEARDVVGFLDHLGLDKATIIGTSRGGLLAMFIGAFAKDRLAGVLFNDIGPDLSLVGLGRIMDYVGISPTAASYAEMASHLKSGLGAAFTDLPDSRWLALAERWFDATPTGIGLTYDPKLRDALLAGAGGSPPDLWALFDGLADIPLAVVRGANSDLLTAETVADMQARRPDLIAAEVPNRGHVPFLDEPESLDAIAQLFSRI